MTKPIKRKAFAYITRNNKFLVFEHVGTPEAGIQVPAGSIELGETPREAALREAQEETGLKNLSIVLFLGEQIQDMSDFNKREIHHRYFYHLSCDEETPITWEYSERYPSDQPTHDSSITHRFRFYWVDIHHPPTLIADQDYYVAKLQSLLRSDKKNAQ